MPSMNTQQTSAANTLNTVSLDPTNGGVNPTTDSVQINMISFSYSGAPTGGKLQIAFRNLANNADASIPFDIDVTGSGQQIPVVFNLPALMIGPAGCVVQVRMAAGGGVLVSKLNVNWNICAQGPQG